jgi:long-chain acyl-CoA synthetase
LSNGKKVVPSYIEGLLMSDECIDQAAICGEGRNFLTALVVPHWDNVRRALRGQGTPLDHEPEAALARHPAVISLLEGRMDGALSQVANWERVKKFVVLTEPFSVANDEMTVSLKLCRNVVLAHHELELEALYRPADQASPWLDLDPGASPRQVAAVQALGHAPFQPLVADRLEKGRPEAIISSENTSLECG